MRSHSEMLAIRLTVPRFGSGDHQARHKRISYCTSMCCFRRKEGEKERERLSFQNLLSSFAARLTFSSPRVRSYHSNLDNHDIWIALAQTSPKIKLNTATLTYATSRPLLAKRFLMWNVPLTSKLLIRLNQIDTTFDQHSESIKIYE